MDREEMEYQERLKEDWQRTQDEYKRWVERIRQDERRRSSQRQTQRQRRPEISLDKFMENWTVVLGVSKLVPVNVCLFSRSHVAQHRLSASQIWQK